MRSLQELYTVAIGVALAKAMELYVGGSEGGSGHGERFREMTPGLVALVATLVPFYHGAMRHLDKMYVEDHGRFVRRGALLADFLWLFIEAGIFVGMALQLGPPARFGWWLVLLLVFDSTWGILFHFALSKHRHHWAEFKWALTNLPVAGVLSVVLWRLSLSEEGTAAIAFVVPAVAVVRSLIDYSWSWKFYFPTQRGA